MLGGLPPYPPEPSSWKRFLNWAKPALGVAVEELRPDAVYVQHILIAVYDIRFCEQLFDGWMTQLNSSKKQNKKEEMLRLYLRLLRRDAGLCSKATNALLQCHAQFAHLMAQQIDDASKSRFKGLKYDNLETTKLADVINEASRSLLTYVTRMKDSLSSFVSVLEKERTLTGRILGWLKSLFKVLKRLGPIIIPLLGCVALGVSGIAPVASTLWMAASDFCGSASEPREAKEPGSLDSESVLLFFKKIVPKEAQTAQRRLERFDEALPIMKLEAHMKTGRRVTLRGSDAPAVANEWRYVAKKYQEARWEDPD